MQLHLQLENVDAYNNKREALDATLYDFERRVAAMRARHEDFIRYLREVTYAYIRMGMVVIDGDMENKFTSAGNGTAEAYFSSVAQQMGKPLVVMLSYAGAVGSLYDSGWMLKVPKNPRLKHIVAGLLLVADPAEQVTREKSIIGYVSNPKSWVFYFLSGGYSTRPKQEISEELRLDWLNRCKTDPVFRVCLGVV